MIYGIGVDVVYIPRIKQLYERWRRRFLKRIFTVDEINHCLRRKSPWPELAARIGAKEAFAKAVGLGWRQGLHWKLIEVKNLPSGQPILCLYGRASEICKQNGLRSQVTLTHDGHYAVAVVVLYRAIKGEEE